MPGTATATQVAIEQIHVSAYKIPTDQPEADGTASWDSTTLALVEIEGGGHTGLNLIRNQGPAGMDIAAGEYGYDLHYFRRMLDAQAVDVLQADVTRCGGVTGFLQVGALCNAHCLELSSHCAPSESMHPCCAIMPLRPLEYFHDHDRIEHLLFDGALTPEKGALHPDLSRPGMGLEFKHADAEQYLVWKS